MEATFVYPNEVPVLASTGLGVGIAGIDPDHVPLKPNLLNNVCQRVDPDSCALDARGVMRLLVRNALGYSFLRPHQRNKLQRHLAGKKEIKKKDWKAQASFYRINYRDFVPHDLMIEFLENECPPQEDCYNLSKWSCAAASLCMFWEAKMRIIRLQRRKYLRLLEGLQIAQFLQHQQERKLRIPHSEAELASVTVDGTVRYWDPEGGIRTITKEAYTPDRILRCEYSSHPCVLWAANRVTVSTLDLREPPQIASKLFDVTGAGTFVTIYDIRRRASNPFQFVVGTGVAIEIFDSRMARQPVISWLQPQSYSGEPDVSFGAIDEVNMSNNANDSQGFILSSLKRHKITTLYPFEQNRKRKRGEVMSLIPLRFNEDDDAYIDKPSSSVGQLVAADANLDLRMEDGGEYTRLTGICAMRNESSECASIYQLNSLGDLFSHQVSFSRSQTKSYYTAVQANLPCGVTAQYEPTQDTVSRRLPIPVDAMVPEYDTESMQTFITLPLKILRRQFPRLPEDKEKLMKSDNHIDSQTHATASSIKCSKASRKTFASQKVICRFTPSNAGENTTHNSAETDETLIRNSCSKGSTRSSDGDAEALSFEGHALKFLDMDELVETLCSVCDPSASLYQLHRFVIDRLNIELSSAKLLLFLRSRSEFQIRTVIHSLSADRLRVLNPSLSGVDNVHYKKEDPRILACNCRPNSHLPCKSWSCMLLHAIAVSRSLPDFHLDDTAPSSAVMQDMPQEFADVISAAQILYGDI
ncbi:uncharacterized protein PHALS_07819 [Plasmopara halstedii]|uniref:TAF1C beta-propeller domain-containing protein n=1 Tax=Plasmopara halstedii TaxID=4781 RepID=A0A0P1B5J2_PLAHL|nr:uncharacterized protein PHALS_07819 [Plasmopara halstedii]CEG50093.1 hypothetical protein PHALS_07819 [Plasmopara halstedii]|eukprot:XP_024586462.1 hypothetical protein PHALS_07819 [Plasmopara halstedii]